MKSWIFLFSFLTSAMAMSQRSVDREIGEFRVIKVYDLITVNLIKSDQNRVSIKGIYADEIRFVNRDGILKIKMQLDKKFRGENTFVEVYYTDLAVIDANEGSTVVCNEQLQQHRVELRAQEGGSIRAGLKVDNVRIRAVTGGSIYASGVAESQEITLNTGGIFEGRDLRTTISSVNVSAGGEAELFASESVDIQIRAGGDVSVWGDPARVFKRQIFGGRVSIKD